MTTTEELLDALAADPRADHPAWEALWEARPVEALPRLVEIGARAPMSEQAVFWSFVGTIAAERELPDECERALVEAEPHIRAAIAAGPADESIWYLLSAATAVRGLGLVATALEDFVAGVANAACPGCDADVEIAWEDADPPRDPIEPLDPVPSGWTEDDATARLLALAELAGRADVAEVLQAWEGTALCPECDERFRVRPAHLAYYRSWANS